MHKVTFNGWNLHDYCIINRALPVTTHDGQKLTFEIDITIKQDVEYNIDMLNRILFTKEAKRLVLGSQPDRYLLCKLIGDIEYTSRFRLAEATLTFESETPYWLQDYEDEEPPLFKMDNFGRITVDNKASAPAYPQMSFRFPSDNGYLGVVAPNGYIELGSVEEQDNTDVPSTHRVVYEEMHAEDMDDWVKLTSNSHSAGMWVGDYEKLNIGTGDPRFDQNGIMLSKSNRPLSGHYWNTWGYVRDFEEDSRLPASEFNNFKMHSRIRLEDSSGKTTNTGMFLIVIMDELNRPIMTTSLYNVASNSNEVTITAKINDFKGNYRTSKIVHTAKFPRGFRGTITMEKEGNNFHWFFDSNKEQTIAGTTTHITETFSIGNIAYIKNSASHYYHYDGTRYPIKEFTRGRRNTITGSRMHNGKRQYEISFEGVAIAWLNAEDLTKNASGVGETRRQEAIYGNRTSEHRTINSQLAGLVAKKVLVIGGTWDNTEPFSHTNLSSVVVDRLNNNVSFKDINNTFTAGDILTINNATGEILLNGSTYQGYIDPSSRFFTVDYGETDIQIVKSPWASMPEGNIQIQERWR